MKDKKPILVIGGGISGMTTAIEAAETGFQTILVEKLPYLGGRVVKMNRYFPKMCPPYCGLEINFKRIKQNSRIIVYTSSTVEDIAGVKGNFIVKLKIGPHYVNNNCTCCGKCEKVCPVVRNDEFNYNLTTTKAIYLPHELAFPFKYHIDELVCEKEKCNKCVEVCEYKAIDFSAKEEIITLEVGAIVFATGWKPYDAGKLYFNKFKNVITNVMMERLAAMNSPDNGIILRPLDNLPVKSIAFIQCAGSRDENHLPYCSGVCCSVSLKQALNFVEQNKDANAKIFYIDLRVNGRNEDFLEKVKKHGQIKLIKGKVGNIELNPENGCLFVEAEDVLVNKKIREEFDLVVLATGIIPECGAPKNVIVNEEGFIVEKELPEGIFAVSNTKEPMDVSASLKDATGKALKAIQVII